MDKVFIISLSVLTITTFISFILVIFFSQKFKHISREYNAIQKIHKDYVPPFGGLVIFLNYFLYIYLYKPHSFILDLNIFIPSLIILIIGLKEDIFFNVRPSVRFFVIFLASIFFIYNSENLPTIDIYFINNLFTNYPLVEILFYSIGLTALSNGVNMVDGMNGLAGFVILSVISGLISLLLINDIFDIFFNVELIGIAVPLVIFLIFNFPYGKIFLGDSGAYWLGWIVGVIIIISFSHQTLNTWGAVLLICYPILEVVFSTIRKLLQKKNPLKPDLEHIHLKLYYTLKGPTERSKEFNSFTSLCLMPLWFTPSLLIIWSHFYSHLTFLAILIVVFIYIYFYLVLKKTKNY